MDPCGRQGQWQATLGDGILLAFHDCVDHTYIMMSWEYRLPERDIRDFMQRLKQELRPSSMMRRAAFINFADATLTQEAAEKAYFGENKRQLE